jgi:purine-nucleoside/S-methyl-5'-thioadenosine phosphorylase / adenosine deaminase
MTLPRVPEAFYWSEQSWGMALQCRALDVAPHLFTTRQLELSSPEDFRRLGQALGVGVKEVVTLTQVHGREVIVIRRGEPPLSGRPEADVLVSNAPDIAIAVRAADCVPVLLADRASGAVAAVHAGWRGTAARAAVAAVDTLSREFGTRPADLIAAVGPSIGSCCYEVGTELVDAFAAAGHERYLIDRWFISPPSQRGAHPLASRADGKLRLDLAGANRDQLVLAGMRESNIHNSGLCTAMHLDVLTSYRVEKSNAGRLAGVIRSRGSRSG